MRYVIKLAGLEVVGLWSLTMGFVAFVRLMDLTGANGLARMLAINPDDEKIQSSYIDTLTLLLFTIYVLLALITYLPLRYALTDSVDQVTIPLGRELLVWAMISMPINVLGLAQLSAIDGIGRADIRSLVNIGGFAAYGLLAVTLIPSNGIIGLAYAQLSQYVVVLIISRWILVSRLKSLRAIPTQFSIAVATSSMHYGFRLQASSIPMTLFDPFVRIMLGRTVGLEFLGVYDLSYKLAGSTRTLVQASLTPLVPEFARLYRSDINASRTYHANVNQKSLLAIAISFSLLIIVSPALSLFLLSDISAQFIFSVAVLSLGWGIATFGLVTQLYARAAGILRWSILGQWFLVILGIGLVLFTTRSNGSFWIPVAIAFAIMVGHLLALIGEIRQFSLTWPGSRKNRSTYIAVVSFIVVGIIFAGISMSNLQLGE
jgi:O-antigen/teichoic acid export membrane protein